MRRARSRQVDGLLSEVAPETRPLLRGALVGHVGDEAVGRGVEPNVTEAVNWLRRAAQQGFAPAQTKLGLAYEYRFTGYGELTPFLERGER
mgnify:CR=1 FL=1